MTKQTTQNHGDEIAIIGAACRFPGAKSLAEYWQNLRDGNESIKFLSDEELRASGVDSTLMARPDYVRATSRLEDLDLFDAAFFGYAPKDAEIMDPQHRFFLECAWEALENAGYDAERYKGWIGVYGGSGNSLYRWDNLASHPGLIEEIGLLQVALQNEKDFLATKVAYKLNLHGPAITVQTACSTSLVALHQACQSLLAGECNMALAGAVSIDVAPQQGYLYKEGGVASPDGRCRAFDKQALGAIGGSGVGLVVLKLLEEALADGDSIYAVIKGSAVNNDGSRKVGFTAPSVEFQAKVISEALEASRVAPRSISYIETHGSGTPLGDPIEIAALTQAFRYQEQARGFCAIGSVKTNIGHLDTAAGIAGLLKVVLALQHQQLPPHLHFREPNPAIDFENSPFFVNTQLRNWHPTSGPRRAGVSSFGMGGTNAHVILEEAPVLVPTAPADPPHVLVFSARTATALEAMTERLLIHLRQDKDQTFSDSVYTYQVGRKVFAHRRMLVCQDREDAIQQLEKGHGRRVFTSIQPPVRRSVAFLFPGLGDQYVNMGRELYGREEVFRACIDQCAELLKPLLGRDLRTLLYPQKEASHEQIANHSGLAEYQLDLRAMLRRGDSPAKEVQHELRSTILSQTTTFVVEYALAHLWLSWGVVPQALVGYSLGEYVAACLAGVFSLEEALTLVVKRAELIEALAQGAMLAISLPYEEVQPLLSETLCIAVIGSPVFCVVSGDPAEIATLAQRLSEMEVVHKNLQVSHAFHSDMMAPAMVPFVQAMRSLQLRPPKIPFLSNVTGTWITDAEATDPAYWASHLREPVRFSSALHELLREPERILLEVGPGRTLCGLALQCMSGENIAHQVALPSLPASFDHQSETALILTSLGKLWLAGVEVNWMALHNKERRRVSVPTYPFEHQRYWIEPYGLLTDHTTTSFNESLKISAIPSPLDSSAHARPALLNSYAEPRTAVEQTLATIYGQLLGIGQVGIYDNFFELGGDSLLGTRMITLARVAGIYLTPDQLFQHPTIAVLGEIAGSTPSQHQEAQGAVVGRLALTPLQKWYLAQPWHEPHRWSLASLHKVTHPLEYQLLQQAIWHLLKHHDGLRLHFVFEQGQWHGSIPSPDEIETIPFNWRDLSNRPEQEQQATILSQAQQFRKSLNLFTGPALRIVYFDCGAKQVSQLLFLFHHLIFDGFSMSIFLHDLQSIYRQLEQGKQIRLLPKTTSVKRWGERLGEYANSAMLRSEFDAYWRTLPWDRIMPLPVDYPENRREDTRGAARSVQATVSRAETTALLTRLVNADTTIMDVLLTALMRSFGAWIGTHPLYLDVVDMGREPLFNDIDLSNTIGQIAMGRWFLLEMGEDCSYEEALQALKGQMRRVPGHGIGQYLFTFLSDDPEIRAFVETIPLPEVLFNYLGQLDAALHGTRTADSLFSRPLSVDIGSSWDPQELRDRPLHFELGIIDGQLWINCEYGQKLYRHATIVALVDRYREVLQALILGSRNAADQEIPR